MRSAPPVRGGTAQSAASLKQAAVIGGAALLVAALLSAEFRRPLNSDSAWLLYLARRVVQGDRLYIDLIEINPPLIVWLQLPIAFLSRFLQLNPTLVFRVGVLLWLAICVGLCLVVVAYRKANKGERGWLLLLLLLVLLGWTRAHFGEREHIAFAALLPYLFLTAALVEGKVFPRKLRLLIGAIAAVGLALKPHLILVWPACLGLVCWKQRSLTAAAKLDNATIAGLLLMYAATVVFAFPEYLRLIVLLGPVYRLFARKDIAAVILNSVEALGAIMAVLAYGLLRKSVLHRGNADVFALATMAFLAAVVMQRKGFSYHYYPVSASTLVLCGVVLLNTDGSRMNRIQRVGRAVLALLLVLGLSSGAGWSLMQLWREDPVYRQQRVLASYIREHASDRSVMRLGYEDNFPLVDMAGASWSLRFPNLWFVESLYREQLASSEPLQFRPPSAMSLPERWCYEAVLDDFIRRKPSLLLITRPFAPGVSGEVNRFNYLDYFSQDARFTSALHSYRRVPGPAEYSVFVRLAGAR